MTLSFIEILCVIIFSYIGGIVSTIVVALNVASNDTNKKLEEKEDQNNGR